MCVCTYVCVPLCISNLIVYCSGPEGTCFEGGVFPARLVFPPDYPLSPPKMKFTCDMFHPNIFADGRVCISILHAPGDDPMGYELSAERWSPVQSVEKILLSVVSMLAGKETYIPIYIDLPTYIVHLTNRLPSLRTERREWRQCGCGYHVAGAERRVQSDRAAISTQDTRLIHIRATTATDPRTHKKSKTATTTTILKNRKGRREFREKVTEEEDEDAHETNTRTIKDHYPLHSIKIT